MVYKSLNKELNRCNEAGIVLALPQSLLLIASEHHDIPKQLQPLLFSIFCEADVKGCLQCRNCKLIKQNAHPDITFITQEKQEAAIKIDQIRLLQQTIYQTGQCKNERVIVIYPAHELNRAAANALLKILEEPPLGAYFILIATHLNTLPKTIISRCQKYQWDNQNITLNTHRNGYLMLGSFYDFNSSRGKLFSSHEQIIQELILLSENTHSLCQLANTYSERSLSDWLWFFHLLVSTILRYQALPDFESLLAEKMIKTLAMKHTPMHYFKQLDMIQWFKSKLNQDLPLNPMLVLETLLMGFV